MFSPPPVVRARGPVHRSLDHSVERRHLLTLSVTPPPVLLVQVHLVVEAVIDADVGPRLSVNPVHVLVKLWAVSIPVPVVIGYEEVGVDHLVQERLDKVLPRPQLQKRNRQADGAETLPGTEPEKRKGYNKPAGFSTLCSDLRQY